MSPYIVPGLKYKEPSNPMDCIERIVAAVVRNLKVDTKLLVSRSRTATLAEARQISMYMIRERYPHITLKTLADYFGGRDHTTVVHSVQKVKDLVYVNDRIKLVIEQIEQDL